MKEFDLVVVGSGSGHEVVSEALRRGLKVALVEEGPLGGTCLNRGCIPSKMLIHVGEVAETIRNSEVFGIKARIENVDFEKVVSRVSNLIDGNAKEIERSDHEESSLTLFKKHARFVGMRTIKVGNEKIMGKKVLIAAGSRPAIPPIKGLDKVPYATSTEALRLKRLPKILTIIGGGYIAAELAYFFGSLGSKINIIQRNSLLLPNEDFEIANTFTETWKKKHNLLLEHDTESVSYSNGEFTVVAKNLKTLKTKKILSDQLLVATGRVPNADLLDVSKSGVEVNERGFVKVNEFMETSAPNIWALGDIAGIYMFKHSANLESEYVNRNMFGKRAKVDYTAMPHAVFSSPQIAGVGMTEQELKKKNIAYVKGHYNYADTAMGWALEDNVGYVKVLAEPKTKKILGCHIIGTHASTLIHEVIVAMKYANNTESISESVHIHPALSEVVQMAFYSIEW